MPDLLIGLPALFPTGLAGGCGHSDKHRKIDCAVPSDGLEFMPMQVAALVYLKNSGLGWIA